MPNNLWKWAVGGLAILAGLYWLNYYSSKKRVQASTKCPGTLDLPDKGRTLGGFSLIQASNLAKECNDVFDAWISTGYGQDALIEKLTGLTNDQLYAVMTVYDGTYQPGLIEEIGDDYTYMIPQYVTGGKGAQLLKRLKALKSGA
ncbi:hypothetical protein [Fibrella aquatilis]|uniref:Uncharacterized protein n=1 Tax=Fibrella aquatilis TaxID=2817059 RepID=A0A939G517_9BACT|nr:hypothetical protein [Fibrella aquatilis]MBO0930362.1 hypothetical protein [Fibrella aquatilis]